MGHRRPTYLERSQRGECFTAGCTRKPAEMITFRGDFVWACDGHKAADGLYS